MTPTTPAQQAYIGELHIPPEPGLLNTHVTALGSLGNNKAIVYYENAVHLYQLTATGPQFLASAGNWQVDLRWHATMDDMVLTVYSGGEPEWFCVYTPGDPWTVQEENLCSYSGDGVCISGDQSEIVVQYYGFVGGWPSSPLSTIQNWECSSGPVGSFLIGSPRAGRWLRQDDLQGAGLGTRGYPDFDDPTDIHLMDENGNILDTVSFQGDWGGVYYPERHLTWIPLAANSHCYFYARCGFWTPVVDRALEVRYRVLTTTGDTIAWDGEEQSIRPDWGSFSNSQGAIINASSWRGQVAISHEDSWST